MYRDILNAIKKPTKLSHIMYKTRMNCTILHEHLDDLLTRNLCEKTCKLAKPRGYGNRAEYGKQDHYIVTTKGTEVLSMILEVEDILGLEMAA